MLAWLILLRLLFFYLCVTTLCMAHDQLSQSALGSNESPTRTILDHYYFYIRKISYLKAWEDLVAVSSEVPELVSSSFPEECSESYFKACVVQPTTTFFRFVATRLDEYQGQLTHSSVAYTH